MDNLKKHNPTAVLDEYRGKIFNGEWPTLPELFEITLKRFPQRNCYTDFDGPDGSKHTISYTEAYEKIITLAKWLSENGVKHGDRVAVTGKNGTEWAIVYLATLFAGGIICPIDYALKIEEQENLLSVAEPKFLFCDEEKYVQYEKKDTPYKLYSINPKFPEKYVYNLKPAGEPEIQRPTEDETAAILFTSGTTGNPKGVMLSHRNFVSDAFAAQTQMIVTETDIFYALLPLHHAYTMLAVFIEAFCLGGELVFGKSMVVSRIMKELKEGQITMLMGVPMLFNKFMQGIMKGIRAKGIFVYGFIRFLMGVSYCIKKVFRVNPGKAMFKSILKQANLYTVRIAICGGGPLAKSVFKLYNEMGINFVQGYGLTETSPILTLNPLEHFKIESVGRYFSRFMEMKIMDPDSEGVGEIVVKGPMVMQGYYKMPEETAKMFTEDGWFKTGDLGWLDKENYLMLAGRVKNMIVTEGGKNVYPEEIEDMFQLQTDIQQITVQGYIANEAKTQEELEALVYPSDELFARLGCTRETADKAVVEAEIKKDVEAVNRNLLPYQRMTRITILEKPLEMTTTLKVKRNYKK